jgi:hypothetical protein
MKRAYKPGVLYTQHVLPRWGAGAFLCAHEVRVCLDAERGQVARAQRRPLLADKPQVLLLYCVAVVRVAFRMTESALRIV